MRNTIDKIKNWNPENETVHKLLGLINEYRDSPVCQGITQFKLEALIDFSSLPCSTQHEFLIDKISDYPIWTVDFNGNCLVGDACDGIENISEILKHYQENKREVRDGNW